MQPQVCMYTAQGDFKCDSSSEEEHFTQNTVTQCVNGMRAINVSKPESMDKLTTSAINKICSLQRQGSMFDEKKSPSSKRSR